MLHLDFSAIWISDDRISDIYCSNNHYYFLFQYMFNQPPPLGIQIVEERELERPSRPEDDLIPFSDTPQISRFGPISRRIICPQSVPTQSQAIIGDETRPTSVVRHSKHMSRPVPVSASLLHQNGKNNISQIVNLKILILLASVQ